MKSKLPGVSNDGTRTRIRPPGSDSGTFSSMQLVGRRLHSQAFLNFPSVVGGGSGGGQDQTQSTAEAKRPVVENRKCRKNQVEFAWTLPVHKLFAYPISLTAAAEFHGQLALSTNWEVMKEEVCR